MGLGAGARSKEDGPRNCILAVSYTHLVTLAGLGIVVVNALSNSPWGVFTIGMTIPIAVVMGWWMFKSHAGKITVTGPSIFGIVLLIGSVIAGHWVAQTGFARALTFTPHQITYLMAIYGLVASVLPVWLVLEPVSYTHLDVYKRQAQHWPAPHRAASRPTLRGCRQGPGQQNRPR